MTPRRGIRHDEDVLSGCYLTAEHMGVMRRLSRTPNRSTRKIVRAQRETTARDTPEGTTATVSQYLLAEVRANKAVVVVRSSLQPSRQDGCAHNS